MAERSFFELETDAKTQRKIIKFCCLVAWKVEFKKTKKQHTWKEITTAVSSVGVDSRSPVDG